MTTRRAMLAAAGASLATLGTSQAANAFDSPFAATTTFGVLGPLTGPDKYAGEQLANGVRAAIEDSNRSRGQLDRVFILRTFDDENSVASAIVNSQFAASDGNVIAVIGHLGGRATEAALRTYGPVAMPVIVPTSSYDKITAEGYRNVFRLATRDSDEGRLAARFVIETIKPKNVYVLVADGDYGYDVAQTFTQTLSSQKVPWNSSLFAFDRPDFPKLAATVRAAKPDYVYLCGSTAEMGEVIPLLRKGGYAGPLGAPQGFFTADTIRKYTTAVEGLIVSTSMPYLAIAPAAHRVMTDFEGRYGTFTPLSAFGYASAQLIMNAIRRGGARNRLALARTLATGGSFDTVVGSFTFGPTGDTVDPNLYFYTVREGKWAFVRSAHPSSFLSR